MALAFFIVVYGYAFFIVLSAIVMGVRRLVYGRDRGPLHHIIVEKAKRDRLTAQERERRLRAIYPTPWVPRSRWPVSGRS